MGHIDFFLPKEALTQPLAQAGKCLTQYLQSRHFKRRRRCSPSAHPRHSRMPPVKRRRRTGRSITNASGPFGVGLRQLAAGIEAADVTNGLKHISRNLGWCGKASLQFAPPRKRLVPIYELSASFELEARPVFLER